MIEGKRGEGFCMVCVRVIVSIYQCLFTTLTWVVQNIPTDTVLLLSIINNYCLLLTEGIHIDDDDKFLMTNLSIPFLE